MNRNEALLAIGVFVVASLTISLCTWLAGHIMGGFLFCGLLGCFVSLLEHLE